MANDNVFVPKQGQLSALKGWIAGELGAAIVRLYTNNVVYTPDRVPADFVEAAFAGYVPQGPLAWPAPFTNASNKAETDSPNLTWTYSLLVGTATVFGIYITNPAKTVLLAVIPFQAPVVLTPVSPNLSRQIAVTDVSEL